MDIKAEEISKIIREQIGSYAVDVDVAEVGSIISIGDGIARVHGVENAMAGEMLEFPHGVFGIALNLEEESVGAVLLGEFKEIKEGDLVKRTGRIISVPEDHRADAFLFEVERDAEHAVRELEHLAGLAFSTPCTRAMPSPIEMMLPTSATSTSTA